jgi:predicted extracellular nuclease
VVLGDLNDEPAAATTQIFHGPAGSELGTGGFDQPDKGDAWRLWNLALKIPEKERFSRVYRGRGELIDHLLVSHALLGRVGEVHTVDQTNLPSVTEDPSERRSARGSDHAPVVVQLNL